jgi:hypothetical protein
MRLAPTNRGTLWEANMTNIKVGRYSNPETKRFWQGWIEPEDLSWVIFVNAQGRPVIFMDRDPITGAVR